jgi:hypothetical protein
MEQTPAEEKITPTSTLSERVRKWDQTLGGTRTSAFEVRYLTQIMDEVLISAGVTRLSGVTARDKNRKQRGSRLYRGNPNLRVFDTDKEF